MNDGENTMTTNSGHGEKAMATTARTQGGTRDDDAPPRTTAEREVAHSGSGSAERSFRRTPVWVAGLVIFLVAAVVVMTVLAINSRRAEQELQTTLENREHAERIALDYAVGAATVDYQDLDVWHERLTSGTSDELTEQFDATAPPLQEILVPLQWTSTSTPIAAKVGEETDGVFVVSAFVDVDSTSVQNPEGARSTVTYTVTVDGHDDWVITDVGGPVGGLPR